MGEQCVGSLLMSSASASAASSASSASSASGSSSASASSGAAADPLAPLAGLPGVAESVDSVRKAVDRVYGHRVMRRRAGAITSEAALRGARGARRCPGPTGRWRRSAAGATSARSPRRARWVPLCA